MDGNDDGQLHLASVCLSVDTDQHKVQIIIIIIKNEKIRVTLCENAAGALYIVNKMCVDGLRNVEG